MAKYVLVEWEINGYNDSDWMIVYYDSTLDKLVPYQYATTRFGSCQCQVPDAEGGSPYHVCNYSDGISHPERILMPTLETVERARVLLAEHIFSVLVPAEERTVMEPNVETVLPGLRVSLKEAARTQVKEVFVCDKCHGSGKWTNPRNSTDKRPCFACKGAGEKQGAKVKGTDGKLVWDKLPAGLSGEVVKTTSFGTFYRNGYSKPDANNTSVQFRTDDGKVVSATLAKLRLERDFLTWEHIRDTAQHLSHNHGYDRISKSTWLTHNYALDLIMRGHNDTQPPT
jgi:hypothetical protein